MDEDQPTTRNVQRPQLTKQTQEMLSAVNRAELVIRVLQLPQLLGVLPALKPVEQVVAKRLVEIQSETGGDFCCQTAGDSRGVSVCGNSLRAFVTHRRRSGSSFCKYLFHSSKMVSTFGTRGRGTN